MSHEMSVQHMEGDLFAIDIRGHRIFVDQPVSDGGLDTAPTPSELFVAGLASCVAFYARRFLARHDLSAEGLSVSTQFEIGGRPAKITDITVHITPPPSLPEERRAAFLAVASHCTVHNTLTEPSKVNITMA